MGNGYGSSGIADKMNAMSKGKRWGVIIAVLVVLLVIVWALSSIKSIPQGHVGVVFSKFGDAPAVKDRFIVEKGEKGIQREVLLPGIRMFGWFELLWKIDVEKVEMKTVDVGFVGIVKALDGTPMAEGQILAKDDWTDENGVFHMGEKGPREKVLVPGTYPLNPYYLKVETHPAAVIETGSVGVLTRLVGDDPPAGTILVDKNTSFRGIQREILQPGTYYFNPKKVKVVSVEAVLIEKGFVGVVTKKVGKEPPYNTILVDRDSDFRGIQREVLQPGMYYQYSNPHEFKVKVVKAVEVPDGHVGVQIARTGSAKPADQLLAEPGQRGVLAEILSPGVYYLNPFEFEVAVFDTRQQRYEMTGAAGEGDTKISDGIKFLSDDGFEIEIDLTVLYQVLPQDAPYVVATIGREVRKDVQEKIIRPSARSFARIIGSMNKGEEFVHGATRQAFQNALHKELAMKAGVTKVQINATLIRHFEVPADLRAPITAKVIAQKLREQYTEQQNTQKANAELEKQKQLVDFESEQVKAQTKKMQATIVAEQLRDVAKIDREKKAFEAEGDAKKIRIHAEAELFAAQKEAEGTLAKKTAEAEGQKKLVSAWGQPGAENLVAYKLVGTLDGATFIPLEWIMGGGGGTDSKGNTIRHFDVLQLIKTLGIEKSLQEKGQK